MLWLIISVGVIAAVAFGAALSARGMPGALARRTLSRLRPSIVSTVMIFAVIGTTLAVAALTLVTGISTGFQIEMRRRVLGVNSHIVVLRYGFAEYQRVMEQLRQLPEVVGVGPFMLNEMMLVSENRLAGVLLKGVDPEQVSEVLDIPQYLVAGSEDALSQLRSDARAEGSSRRPTWLTPWDEAGDEEASALELVGVGEEGERAGEEELDDAVSEALELDLAPRVAPEPLEDLPGILLGCTLAEELDVTTEDTLRVVTPLAGLETSLWAPEAGATRSQEFRVVGIFHSGFDEYDRRLAIVDLRESQAFSDRGDIATGLELRLDDPGRAEAVAEQVRQELGSSGYQVIEWQELNRNFFAALSLQKLALTLVVGALVLVAGLLIIATLVMMISERKRDIAILKAMGATDTSLMRAFLLIGGALGTLGTFLGTGLGYILSRVLEAWRWELDAGVYLIDHLPVVVDPMDYAVVAAASLGVTFLATLIPAWTTAARMNPVDGLKQE